MQKGGINLRINKLRSKSEQMTNSTRYSNEILELNESSTNNMEHKGITSNIQIKEIIF